MTPERRRLRRIPIRGILICGLGMLAASLPARQDATGTGLVIYLEDGPLLTTATTRNEGIYLPVIGLVRGLGLPYTDATGLGTLTVRGPNGVLEASTGSATITIDGQPVELAHPVLRDPDTWVASLDFLNLGLASITGFGFDLGPDPNAIPRRIVAGNLRPARLDLAAQEVNGLAQLTLRSTDSINVRVQQNPEQNRVILAIDRAPMIPSREALDFRNAAVRSVAFDDADGRAKVIVETSPELANVRLVPSEGNRTFLVEFVSLNPPPEITTVPSAAERDARVSLERVRVIVVDPGHGGLDSGTRTHGTLEKDLTLVLARRLRTQLQLVLNGTVILTRDQDVLLTGEQRSLIANRNNADLLISLHLGFSDDPTETNASLFLMQPARISFPASSAENLFQPWFAAFRGHLAQSQGLALMLQARLTEAVPGWGFAVREAPLAVLASATMPSIVVELGNANNPSDLALLEAADFQQRLIEAMASAITAFGDGEGL